MSHFNYVNEILKARGCYEVAVLCKKALDEDLLVTPIRGIRVRYALPLYDCKMWVQSLHHTPLQEAARQLNKLAMQYKYRLDEEEAARQLQMVPVTLVHTIDSLIAILEGKDPEGAEAMIAELSRAKGRLHATVTLETGNVGIN